MTHEISWNAAAAQGYIEIDEKISINFLEQSKVSWLINCKHECYKFMFSISHEE